MRIRRLSPVYSRVSPGALFKASLATFNAPPAVSTALCALYPGREVLLTDSGTTALSFAIEAATRTRAKIVALPAYGCPDIATGAIGAGCRIVLYDVDPNTLSPDEDSLLAALRAGASTVVVAHFFGLLVDIPAVRQLVSPFGVTIIEDAAQHAGGTLRGQRGGAFGDYSVLSFGRGKGVNSGGGGALTWTPALPPPVALPAPSSPIASAKTVAATMAGELLSHPSLFWIPARIPQLKLGQTYYRPPGKATAISKASVVLLEAALHAEPAALEIRRANEAAYRSALAEVRAGLLIEPEPGVCSGALRFPVRVDHEQAASLAPYGVWRSYPKMLHQYPEVAVHCGQTDSTFPGAAELAERLHTLPTHEMLTEADRRFIMNRVRALGAVRTSVGRLSL